MIYFVGLVFTKKRRHEDEKRYIKQHAHFCLRSPTIGPDSYASNSLFLRNLTCMNGNHAMCVQLLLCSSWDGAMALAESIVKMQLVLPLRLALHMLD
jgi:hypothetical protein